MRDGMCSSGASGNRERMSAMGFVEVVAWTAVACGVWLATLSSVTPAELCVAIVAGVPCGVLARSGRRALGASWRFRSRWVRWVLPVTGSLVAETVALVRRSAKGPGRGRLEAVALPAEPVEVASGREALGTLALCAAPGTVVADCDPDRHELTVHVLVSAGPRTQEAIGR